VQLYISGNRKGSFSEARAASREQVRPVKELERLNSARAVSRKNASFVKADRKPKSRRSLHAMTERWVGTAVHYQGAFRRIVMETSIGKCDVCNYTLPHVKRKIRNRHRICTDEDSVCLGH